ncbi:unnamed protein product [Rhizophagus irregularis]|nr:unnamed protein product [Rhizophagus irregularis]
MSTERTIEIRLQSEDNYIDIIDIENLTPPENLLPPLEDTNSIEEYTKNAFDKLLDKEEHNLNFQTKSKGGSKLRSWIYNWGERKNHPTNSNKYIFECNQKLDNGENCAAQIKTSGPTGNIISHLNRKHKIYEHSKPLSTITPSLKQVKIDRYAISSDSHSQMTEDQQKYLKTLLFEWLILDFQPLHLLKSPSFHRFINALNENFELPTDREFRKRIFEAYGFSKNKLKQYIHENAVSVSLTCDLWTSRSKQSFLGVTCHFITPDFEIKEITLAIQYLEYPHTGDAIQQALEKIITQWELQHKQNERLLNAQKKNSEEPEEESDLHRIFYRAITDVETRWSSTYIAWERLIALKPYIDIVISSLNVSKDNNAKEDAKRLNKINLTNNEWDIIRDLLEILGPFAELTEILEGTKYATMSYIYPGIIKLKSMFSPTINSNLDLETNDDAFENHQFEEVDEDDEPDARRKIKINTPINTFGLLDNIKSNLYKALENYFEVIEKEALIAALLDPRKKKTMFANNDQKELAKANLREVYELAKNNTNIHLEKCEPKLEKRKTSTRVYKRSLFSDDESHDLQTEDNEVERYLVMAQIKNDQDPLKWNGNLVGVGEMFSQ